MKNLTARQRQVLEYISTFISEHSYPPSIRDIQKHFGLKSTKGVKDHIDRLVEKGYLNRTDGAARALEVVGRSSSVRTVPVLGKVAAGLPLLADENIQDYLPVSKSIARSEGMFYLKVKGDSMTGAAILEGDLVLVRPQPFVEQGEIAVVLIGDEATVKRFFLRDDHIELQPENPRYQPVRYGFGEILIQGRVIGIQRGPDVMQRLQR